MSGGIVEIFEMHETGSIVISSGCSWSVVTLQTHFPMIYGQGSSNAHITSLLQKRI